MCASITITIESIYFKNQFVILKTQFMADSSLKDKLITKNKRNG